MGGSLSCGGRGYRPDGDDNIPYGTPVSHTNGEVTHKVVNLDDISGNKTPDVSTPPPVSSHQTHYNNNNVFKPDDISFDRPSWKFWQRASLRRSNRKSNSPTKSFNLEISDPTIILPDVVDGNRSRSLNPAPPKPPRSFLFRSSSIHTPASVSGQNNRNSFVFSEAYQNGVNANNGNTNTEGFKSIVKTNVTPETKSPDVNKPMPPISQKCNSLPQNQKLDISSQGVVRRQPKSPTGKIRIVSPELSRKSRLRKKSGEITAKDRHILIMQSSVELLCQKLDPFVIVEDLARAGILEKDDLDGYSVLSDSRLVCENIVQSVMDNSYASFLKFCDVLRSKADYTAVATVLDAMTSVYDVIYEFPSNKNKGSPILDDEKSVAFDVVYFSLESGKIRSVVELEKSRNTENKRHSRDLLSFKRNSRLSFHSLTSDASSVFSEDIINTGIPMVTVSISGHVLCSQKAKALSDVLQKHDCILELHLGKTRLRGPDMEPICKALISNTCLRVIDLRLNSIGNEGATYMAKLLLGNKCLRQLNLSSTGIDSEGCKLISESLKTNSSLIELDLSFLDIGDSGCLAISDMLKQNRCLKKLRLRSDNITWIGCGFLIEGIEQGKTLKELDLSRNFIGDEGAEMILRNLRDESCLREVNLENCGFTSNGCAILSDVILTNKSLRSLDLSVNFIGDQGIMRLSNALERNKHIKTLGLNMCGISNDGFSKLLDVLEINPTLNLLKLCYNRLGREHTNPDATSDNLKYRIRIVTSSNPKLKLLLWGNTFDDLPVSPIAKDMSFTL